MKVGILGLPKTGKTTLFRLLTSAHQRDDQGGRKPNMAVLHVPDPRLDVLTGLYSPKKTTPATIDCVDATGIRKGEMKQDQLTAHLREMDALAHVVRAFPDDSIPHEEGSIDPNRDIATIELELILTDLESIERRLPRLVKNVKRGSVQDQMEEELLKKLKERLEDEVPLRAVALSEDEEKLIRGFGFLSKKPIIHIVNLAEEQAQICDEVALALDLEEAAAGPKSVVAGFLGKVEAEIAELDPDDRETFRLELGIKEPALDKFLRVAYELLGLISFLTSGEDECRAWTIPRGTTAERAAGRIHSDLERGFIRAEVVAYDDLVAAGSMAAAREAGHVRVQGRSYIVQDGDILNIRFSV